MELNRNHYLIAGLFLLLLGIQLRSVETYVLNEQTTRFLASKFSAPNSSQATMVKFMPTEGPNAPKKSIKPDDWIGWAMMSVGSVLVLHSLALKAPE